MLSNDSSILVLDFGSQYTQLICRRLREQGVYSELLKPDVKRPDLSNIKGIILSGGPASAVESELLVPEWVWDTQLPVFGICYGMQAMAARFSGKVAAGSNREFGLSKLRVIATDMPLADAASVWMSHGDHVAEYEQEFTLVATNSDKVPIALKHKTRPYFAVQFHPEVTHTDNGAELLHWFAVTICQCSAKWSEANIADALISDIKVKVLDAKVLLAVSGGVDSTVVAFLLQKALGANFQAVFVDNGLLRQDEVAQVLALFKAAGIAIDCLDAKERFYKALAGVNEPEAKRKIIGKTFIDVFDEYAANSQFEFLAQGTIYPDIIESAGKDNNAEVIKSHHNVGGLPKDIKFKLLEPVACLFKDEVRRLGAYLGVPGQMLARHPFPGPGLGVRVLEEVTPEKVRILQIADAIYMAEITELYHQLSQAFAVLLPVKSVGVVGDQRTYGYVIALRAVTTEDFMTARAAELPYSVLQSAARKILNAIPEVARVVYDITDKPPGTIEWE